MPLSLSSPPATALISTSDLQSQLRLDLSDDSTFVGTLAAAAIELLDGRDGILGRALVSQTWALTLDAFPPSAQDAIRIPLPPLQSVTSIAYIDGDGASQTWASSNYVVDTAAEPGLVRLAWNASWPETRRQANAVTVTFVAGYGDAADDVPQPIRQAALMLAAQWYEHRQPIVVGASVEELPMAARALLAPYRQPALGRNDDIARGVGRP